MHEAHISQNDCGDDDDHDDVRVCRALSTVMSVIVILLLCKCVNVSDCPEVTETEKSQPIKRSRTFHEAQSVPGTSKTSYDTSHFSAETPSNKEDRNFLSSVFIHHSNASPPIR